MNTSSLSYSYLFYHSGNYVLTSDNGGSCLTMEQKCPLLSALWRGHGEAITAIYWADGHWWATNYHCATEIQYCPWCGVCLDKLVVRDMEGTH